MLVGLQARCCGSMVRKAEREAEAEREERERMNPYSFCWLTLVACDGHVRPSEAREHNQVWGVKCSAGVFPGGGEQSAAYSDALSWMRKRGCGG